MGKIMESVAMRKENKRKRRPLILIGTVVTGCILLLTAARTTMQGTVEPVKTEFLGMNTYIMFTAYGSDAGEALQAAEQKMADLESAWSVTEESSEIYQVNHSNGEPVTLSGETAEVVGYALSMAEETDGALEPTIYPALTAWGFTTGENRVPDREEIQEILKRVGYRKIILNGNQIQLSEGMELDLGAVGKGYAGDVVTELLKKQGITSALLDIGGNIQAIGAKPDGTDWQLGIRSPFGEGTLGVLSVADKAVVTSGNYERYFVGSDGKEYGHIINPETGYPVENELASITIIAKEGRQGDALSTALYVKGLGGAITYWKEHPDFDLIAVTDNGEIYLTEKIADAFSLNSAFGNMKVNVIEK